MLYSSCSLRFLFLIGISVCVKALVHYVKLEKGENGCKSKDGKEIKVGGVLKDPNTCGVYVCQNTEGDALIHYCQRPAPFEMCTTDGVSTIAPFPECCWKCVVYKDCGKKNGTVAEEGGGAAADGEGGATPAPEGDAPAGDGDAASSEGGGEEPPAEEEAEARAKT